jgi:uncharacterized membrane protein
MNWMTLLMPLLLTLMVALPGSLLLTARLTRPDIFFAITVDPSLRGSAAGRAILRQFTRAVIGFSVVGLALTLPGIFAGFMPAFAVALMLAGAAVEFTGLIAAYVNARREVRPFHVESSREREVVVKARPVRPVGGWVGQAGPFLLLALAALCLWCRWDAIPQRFPIHWDLFGRPNGWAIKRWRSVFGSVLLGTLYCLLLGLMMNGIARGVRRIHSSGTDGESESRFLRLMLLMVLVLEYWLAALVGFAVFLPPALLTIFIILGLVVIVAVVVVAVRSGQGGWRLRAAMLASPAGQHAPAGDRTPDECWKGGVIYYNPADPAVWVEKRFGIGWTFNFGNPRAWFLMTGILVFIIAVPVLSILLMR